MEEKYSLLVRRFKLGEELAIWDVIFASTHQSIAKDYHSDLIERWASKDQDMDTWAERLSKTNPFVCIIGQRIVGMAEIDTNGFINYFYVHPDSQGKGVGRVLVSTLELEAERLGLKMVFADVSLTAKTFFLSQGFEIREARLNIILGHAAPNFRMEKILR